MTVIYPSPIFGPVHSRRLGVSLGINLLPADGKVCTFDCIYCECGFNADYRPKQPLPTREEVRSALEARLRDMQQNGPTPDVLTFAGNGEPTAHPCFPEIIEDTLALRDNYFPNAKVSVLSNSTFIHRPAVFEALNKIDNNILKLARVVVGKSKVDDEVLDNLEEVLISSDVGVETTIRIIQRIEERVQRDKYMGIEELNRVLKEEIAALLKENNANDQTTFELPDNGLPYVIMVVGVNGVGKTTTIGKLANKFKEAGRSVVLGAADTFRAAAVDQLVVWAERVGVPIVKQGMGADPASVAYDTLSKAKADHADVVIIDTAGRLHNKINLMNELTKIKNVMKKVIPDAPQEVLLVLDGSTGQNAYEQAKQFTLATEVTALAVTKLDGTAKGGVVIGISDQFHIPVKYIGIGEKMEDLQIFDREEFVDSLFS